MTDRFDIVRTGIRDLAVVRRIPIGDARGYLERLYCHDELAALSGGKGIAQINRTHTSKKGTIRGMHFQLPPHAETKWVTCLRGEVFDVAVDLRNGSRTFLQWHGEILSGLNHKTLAIPEGFAHGFQTLTDDCEMLYFHTAAHRPEAEAGLHPADPMLGIAWPLAVADLSSRDAGHPMLEGSFEGIRL